MNRAGGKKNVVALCSVVIILFGLFLVRGGGKKQSIHTLKETRIMMGTMITITAYHENRAVLTTAIDEAFRRIGMVDAHMSTYKDESELSQLNRAKKPGTYTVSDDLWNVLMIADQLYHQTNGVFDVTIKPLLDLWSNAAESNTFPTEEKLEQARARTGWQTIRLHPETQEVEFTRSDTMIVLGGVAKGYAVDVAVDTLQSAGVVNCLVDAGGDIYCAGVAPEGIPWQIGVRNPFDMDALIDTISVQDQAVVTSGNYERVFSVGEEKFSQIINPLIGYPTKNTASVTIVSSTAAVADGLATALMVMKSDDGIDLIEELPHTEVFIITTTTGKAQVDFSAGFKK